MGRQVALLSHCLLCIKSTTREFHDGETHTQLGDPGKLVYERSTGSKAFEPFALICKSCLQYLRGGNWPTDVYAKLTGGKAEGERAAEALLTA
jgi:hypothetical protein